MKEQTYIIPEIWVEELKTESALLVNSITNVEGKSGGGTIFGYGGGGNGSARAGENDFWDDDDEDSRWDQL